MPALTSLSSKINNTIHPRCNLSFSNYCLDKWVHLKTSRKDSLEVNFFNGEEAHIES
jgi:hypothetical protein